MFDLNETVLLEPLNEVALDRLAPDEILVIETENSIYRFTIDRPEIQRGVLSGGTLATAPVTVWLTSPMTKAAAPVGDNSVLRIGHRAMFFIQSTRGIQCGVTSSIKRLFRLKRVIFSACLAQALS